MGKLLLACLFLIVLLVSGCVAGEETRVCLRGRCFLVEVPQTEEGKTTGLMFRERLDPDKGMLFVFDHEGEHVFWMRSVRIPLDIIWINSEMEVVHISANEQPCGESCPYIKPDNKAKYVLEINGGLSEEMELEVGDRAEINNQ